MLHSDPARALRRIAYNARRVPVLGDAVAKAYRRHFNNARGHVRIFSGVYPDFAAATADVPADRFANYDNEDSASRTLDEWMGVYPNDYPVMFWLGKLFATERRVFDWGGNVGLKYFAYGRYIDYPADHLWVVSELPPVVRLGRTIALRESADRLRFTSDLEGLADADVLLAAGLLHFIDDPIGMLRAAPRLPRHVLLNKVPAYEKPAAVTLQNMGTAICPNHLFNRDALVRDFESLGYELIDEWKSPDVSCEIPFASDRSIDAYSGFYFAKRG